ncbi:MAG: hypothetical protein KDC83_00690 [Flavobacteriales bacterium]|nr:hypothetical protein [Flavobacteriales bacterium]
MKRIKLIGWAQWLFMAAGLLFLVGATDKWDIFLAFAGIFLFAKGYFNWGCNGECAIPQKRN